MLFNLHLLRKGWNRRAKPLRVLVISPLVLISARSRKSRTVWLHLAEVILVAVANSETLVPPFRVVQHRLHNVLYTVQCCYEAYTEPDACPAVRCQAAQYCADRLRHLVPSLISLEKEAR